MKRFIQVALLTLFASTLASAQSGAGRLFDSRANVEKWIKENHVPALGIGIIDSGVLREVRMYGEIKSGLPAPYNSIFNVASLTKPVTAYLALKLISNGDWNLDESLAKYWVDPDVAADPRHKKLTTRLVLSHQTGFKNWRYQDKDNKLRFDTVPGTKFGYSGEGFEYLRRALENKFKKGLDKLCDSLIFHPLGMTDTRFTWDKNTDEARFAHWYNDQGKEYDRNYKITDICAADDLLTTIEDYARFSIAVMKGVGLSPSVFKEMVKPHVPSNNGVFFGLGWEMFLDIGSKKEYALMHSGGDAGVQTLVILLPLSKQGLVIFTNGDNGYMLYERLVVELLDAGKELMNRTK